MTGWLSENLSGKYGSRYSRMDQVKFMEDLGRPYYFKFFKGCLPQILLGPFLNTLTHMIYSFSLNMSIFTTGQLSGKFFKVRSHWKMCFEWHLEKLMASFQMKTFEVKIL